MTQRFTNNARSRLVGTFNVGATSLTIESPTADLFPVANTSDWVAPGDWFKATLESASGVVEIIHVGLRNNGSGVLSNIKRGQDGTAEVNWPAGSVIGLRITAADVEKALAGEFPSTLVHGHSQTRTVNVLEKMTHNGVEVRPVPVRGIVMFAGTIAEINAGWQLCDGTNGTPDLRDRFIIGARLDASLEARTELTGTPTKTGGSKDAIAVAHTHGINILSGNENNWHTHTITVNHQSLSGHVYYGESGPITADGIARMLNSTTNFGGGGGYSGGRTLNIDASHAHGASAGFNSTVHQHSVVGSTASAGADGTNKNLPPYYALAFIMCMPYAP